MKVKDIADRINEIVPLKLALDWDNVGLLIGDGNKNVKSILLTIDITKNVVAEAKKLKTDMIVSYHPVIWDGLKKITPDDNSAVVYELIRSNIAVLSVHTALDIASGGVNDGLAEILGIENAKPIGDFVPEPKGLNYKLIVFVPAKSTAKVANSMFAAGAGAIGNYSNCSFSAPGEGTFLPLAGANPAIGKRGKLEKVPENRLETIVPAQKLDDVIEAMLKSHPYEMPAWDCFQIATSPTKYGLGRIGKLKKPTSIEEIIENIKKHTGAKTFGIVGKEKRTVRTAAVCAGSCGKIINQVIAAGTDLYLTGELKHHQALAAKEAAVTCICLSHTNSERFILKKFAKQLKNHLDHVKITLSKKDADPFNWKSL